MPGLRLALPSCCCSGREHGDIAYCICRQSTLKWGGGKQMVPRWEWRGADRCEPGPSPGREERGEPGDALCCGASLGTHHPPPAAVPASQIVLLYAHLCHLLTLPVRSSWRLRTLRAARPRVSSAVLSEAAGAQGAGITLLQPHLPALLGDQLSP